MKQVSSITIAELEEMASRMYGSFVKGVVDVKKSVMVVDAEMHVDEEQFLLENGSEKENLWGINLIPANFGSEQFIEFDSMINIRPKQHSMSLSVENADVKKQIVAVVGGIVKA